jgi:peptide chain release factor 3
VAFPPIPSFSPELFAYLRCPPAQRKAFAKGVEGLLGEGAVQVLYSRDEYITDPILAAVGQLQFEVVQYRMKDEYGEGAASLDRHPQGCTHVTLC